jgi:hypothetical protein
LKSKFIFGVGVQLMMANPMMTPLVETVKAGNSMP